MPATEALGQRPLAWMNARPSSKAPQLGRIIENLLGNFRWELDVFAWSRGGSPRPSVMPLSPALPPVGPGFFFDLQTANIVPEHWRIFLEPFQSLMRFERNRTHAGEFGY